MHVKKKVGCLYGNKVEYANLKPATCGVCGKYEAGLVGLMDAVLCYRVLLTVNYSWHNSSMTS